MGGRGGRRVHGRRRGDREVEEEKGVMKKEEGKVVEENDYEVREEDEEKGRWRREK